jgi:hypothetical protein
VVKVAAIGKEIRREAMHESKHSHHRRQQWMTNTFITKMLLTGGVLRRDWRFWLGLFLMVAAINVFFMSVDLSLVPSSQP